MVLGVWYFFSGRGKTDMHTIRKKLSASSFLVIGRT